MRFMEVLLSNYPNMFDLKNGPHKLILHRTFDGFLACEVDKMCSIFRLLQWVNGHYLYPNFVDIFVGNFAPLSTDKKIKILKHYGFG
jgi:hypothetical protein